MTGAILDILGGPPAVRAALPDKGERGRDRVRCPACDGPATATDSRQHRGKVLLTCWGGCDRAAIVEAARERLPVGEDELRPNRQNAPTSPARGSRKTRPLAQNRRRDGESRAARGQPDGQSDETAPRIAFAAAIWGAGVRADDTPARRYLAGRLAWPPLGIAPDLPAGVRWIAGSDWPRDGWPRLPREAAGAIVFRLGEPLRGVHVEALSAEAVRVAPKRWRRTVGVRTVFDAGGEGPAFALAEGPVTALACRWLYPGSRCFAAIGSLDTAAETIREIAPLDPAAGGVIEADADETGDRGARAARDALPGARVVWRSSGDAADELAGEIGERLAICEESGATPDEALRIAWAGFGAGLVG